MVMAARKKKFQAWRNRTVQSWRETRMKDAQLVAAAVAAHFAVVSASTKAVAAYIKVEPVVRMKKDPGSVADDAVAGGLIGAGAGLVTNLAFGNAGLAIGGTAVCIGPVIMIGGGALIGALAGAALSELMD